MARLRKALILILALTSLVQGVGYGRRIIARGGTVPVSLGVVLTLLWLSMGIGLLLRRKWGRWLFIIVAPVIGVSGLGASYLSRGATESMLTAACQLVSWSYLAFIVSQPEYRAEFHERKSAGHE